MTTGLIIIAIVVIAAIWFISTYNTFITMKNRVEEAWADIDVQLKRRYDLIPNLVETVKAYAKHEDAVFTQVTEARAKAIKTNGAEHAQNAALAEQALGGALVSLMAVAENYPELKANENFGQLQDELTDTENKIQAARRFYNAVTRDFNTKIEMFPSNVVANMFKFVKREFYDLEETPEQREAVEVDFSDKEE